MVEQCKFKYDHSSLSYIEFTCWVLTLDDGVVYYRLDEFCEALGYTDVESAHTVIPEYWKTTWYRVRPQLLPIIHDEARQLASGNGLGTRGWSVRTSFANVHTDRE
ncbi:12.3 kDa BRO-N-like [Spodoptera frugiperda ascovirus 1a]|uniref:12.3 kDa BRO-N-like n=1 Tax=Spodoptera frugiperda ascovirus 1a TaxID=113370 RepID=Q0E570_SFAVA|nr:12.3 kDa BRO-N-like [Spodoptera frugiperda ascovirus 1a]CAL44631.1 12.3 kDa BRO-N-like [Spodoptera frugiperda ascovirus 1a]